MKTNNCRHRENDDTHRRIEFEGQLSPFYFAVIMFYTCYYLFSCPAYSLCIFHQKGAYETKVPYLKSITISFAFKQSRKVFLFPRYLKQINC